MNVYDFDGTIYNGDSSVDLFIFSIKNKKVGVFNFFKILFYTILYKIKIVNTKKYKEIFFSFLKNIDNLDNFITLFWEKHENKINKSIQAILENSSNNYIITASPEFLVNPIAKRYNAKCIGTRMNNKTGIITGENCSGKEKVNRLKEVNKNFKIENFYTDSITDKPLADIASNSYMVTNKKIKPYDEQFLNNKKRNKEALMVFLLFFVIYFILGILISFSYELSWSFIFESDSPRVFGDYTNIFYDHSRLTVHPLFVLLFQPIIYILKAVIVNETLTVIVFSSIVGGLTVAIIYCFSNLFVKNKLTSLLITLIFGFSFSNIIFNSVIELYNLAALCLIYLWYIIAKILTNNVKVTNKIIIELYFLGILTVSITITNYVIFLIISLLLLISKKMNLKKIIILNLLIILSCFALSYVQNVAWHNTPTLKSVISDKTLETEANTYSQFDLSFIKIKNVIYNNYFNGIISSNIGINSTSTSYSYLDFIGISYLSFGILCIFFILIFVNIIKNIKNNLWLNLGLVLALLFNTLLHYFYGNAGVFLYSQHFLYIFFMLLIINLKQISKNRYLNLFLIVLLIFEIIFNSIHFLDVLRLLNINIKPTFWHLYFNILTLIIMFGIIILLALFLTFLIIWQIKTFINKINSNEECGYLIFTIPFSIILLISGFVCINTTPAYNKLAIFDLKYEEDSGTNIENSSLNIDDEDINNLKNHFNLEIESYLSYADEYLNFIKEYNAITTNEITDGEFYFFGFGNRKKIIYKDGKLFDLENKIVEDFGNVKYDLIIPNIYTVLLVNDKDEYYKIFEDSFGVYITKVSPNKSIKLVKGTDIKIELYNFDNEKYKNVMKTLYGEILFNISDGEIKPNIIVYDETWYRDAAMAAMVLKNTNNLSLIKDWVLSETEIYDKQNGHNEPDNLGEMLYINSLFSEKNDKLINNVIEEANRIAKNNKNGYYITGITDGENQIGYQNAWYELGLKKLGKESNFDKYPSSPYSSYIWWSINGCESNQNYSPILNYPYLDWAQYHCNSDNIHSGYVNNSLYPLSWEKGAYKADYSKMSILSNYYVENFISPTHTWMASEILLFLLAESGHLKI